MSRSDKDRLLDILGACEAVEQYLRRQFVDQDILFDAIRVRLIEIGEAVKDIAPALLAFEPSVPWNEIARMRDLLTHRYFDTAYADVHATAVRDLPVLAGAVRRLIEME